MKKVKKPIFNVQEIICNCADSLRDNKKKTCIKSAADDIAQKSEEYDNLAQMKLLVQISENDIVADGILKKDFLYLYDEKFVKHKDVRPKYYDKIMVLTNGICPFCDLGHVGNLEHYLPKSLFPTYALTPCNLIPICRDCNYVKREESFDSYEEAPFHPYYDESDDVIWLKACLQLEEDGIVASYYIDSSLSNKRIIDKYTNHMQIYKLYNKYAIEAAREISDNIIMWKNGLQKWGEEIFMEYISDIIESLECTQNNSWKLALYRALLENLNILRC